MLDAERLLELLETKPLVTDKSGSKEIIIKNGDVTFEDITFSYDVRKSIIQGISLNAAGGTTTALVGETGGGKSTLLKLIFRFYDVDGGCIKIDGQDIRDITLSSLRDQIGVVPQVWLYSPGILVVI